LCAICRDGAPWRSTIAAALKMSDHTFQRRLTSEGVVQQACRRNAARLVQHHLAYARLSSSEIAYLIGYSDQSTFFRATHRWFGESPGEYRNGTACAGGRWDAPQARQVGLRIILSPSLSLNSFVGTVVQLEDGTDNVGNRPNFRGGSLRHH
jgi:AraC-like DNA-binding protein